MTPDIYALICLFPIAFILHDFEELILFEPWLKKNAGVLLERVTSKTPLFLERQLRTIVSKTTPQFALPIGLIFILTTLSSVLAIGFGQFTLFLLAGSLFFLHGFMHVGQAILLRHYIPALITSVVVVIPYGTVLFWRLIVEGIVTIPELAVYFLIAVILAIPFLIVMHITGEYLYKRAIDFLVG